MRLQNFRYNDRLAIWVGLLIGVASFVACFGISRALGTGPAYRWPAGDQAQHIAGAFAYLDGKWSFPIFYTDRINYPDGVNIIFTDSAPFAGFLAKIFNSLTGIRFNYLGTWFAVLWVGQAAAGAYLMRQLVPERPLLPICGALIALAWPAFLNRHFHLALSSHFLVVFALGLYFATTREPHSWKRLLLWSVLLGIAIWTHIYLFLMSFALFSAATADAVVRKNATLRQAAISNATALFWCTSLAWIGGYQTVGGINATGYGSFRMDLIAYVWPHGSALFPAPLIFDQAVAYEGFNYLGMGAIAIVACALLSLRWRNLRRVTSRPWLALCITGMTLFAITNYITFAGIPVAQLPLPIHEFPFSTFRASGRFGWPLGYLAVFAGLALLYSRLAGIHRHLAALVVCMLTIIQVADARLLLGSLQEGWRAKPRLAAEKAIRSANEVHFDPPIGCLLQEEVQAEATELLALAAREGKQTDSAHIARTGQAECDLPPKLPSVNTVIITAPDTAAAEFYKTSMDCRPEKTLLLCRGR